VRFAFALPPTSPAASTPRSKLPSALTLPGVVLVPPSWFRTNLDGLLRTLVCGSVAPRYRTRVRRVSGSQGPACVPRDGAGPWCLPRDAVHTLRRVPLVSSQHRITAACCLLVVTGTNDSQEQPKPRSTVVPDRSRDAPCRPASEEVGAAEPRPFHRVGDAPIRRSRPPRHQAQVAVDRSRRRLMQHRREHQMPKRRAWQAVRFQAKAARPAPGSANSRPVAPEGVRGEPFGGRSCQTLRGAPLATEVAERANLSREREAANYKALLRRRVRDVAPPLPVMRHSILPWALCPLQGPSGSAPGLGFAKPGKPWSAEALRGPGRPPHRGKPRGMMRPLDPSRDPAT
jgi:hypothetical protein